MVIGVHGLSGLPAQVSVMDVEQETGNAINLRQLSDALAMILSLTLPYVTMIYHNVKPC